MVKDTDRYSGRCFIILVGPAGKNESHETHRRELGAG